MNKNNFEKFLSSKKVVVSAAGPTCGSYEYILPDSLSDNLDTLNPRVRSTALKMLEVMIRGELHAQLDDMPAIIRGIKIMRDIDKENQQADTKFESTFSTAFDFKELGNFDYEFPEKIRSLLKTLTSEDHKTAEAIFGARMYLYMIELVKAASTNSPHYSLAEFAQKRITELEKKAKGK